jgi:hypothetical protein
MALVCVGFAVRMGSPRQTFPTHGIVLKCIDIHWTDSRGGQVNMTILVIVFHLKGRRFPRMEPGPIDNYS